MHTVKNPLSTDVSATFWSPNWIPHEGNKYWESGCAAQDRSRHSDTSVFGSQVQAAGVSILCVSTNSSGRPETASLFPKNTRCWSSSSFYAPSRRPGQHSSAILLWCRSAAVAASAEAINGCRFFTRHHVNLPLQNVPKVCLLVGEKKALSNFISKII